MVPSEAAGDVTIASMNLHCGIDPAGRPYDVEAAIRALDAELIALQEAWQPRDSPDPVAAAASAMGANVHRLPLSPLTNLTSLSIPADVGPGRSGLAVLTTLPVTGYETVRLGRAPGDATTRCAQVLTVTLPDGRALRLAATHLTHRGLSPVQLWQLLRSLNSTTVPTVIAGDLNMPRQVARMTPGFAPAVRGRTWPAELPVAQIDHLLVSRDIKVLSGAVLPPAGSDHRAVRARLRLADAART